MIIRGVETNLKEDERFYVGMIGKKENEFPNAFTTVNSKDGKPLGALEGTGTEPLRERKGPHHPQDSRE